MRRSMGQSALFYARMGWPVFPLFNPVFNGQSVSCSCGNKRCDTIGKHPNFNAVKRGLHGASSNLDEVKSWWGFYPDSSIGIRTGRKMPEGEKEEGCGYVLLDIDEGYKNGKLLSGEDQFEVLSKAVGGIPDTWETTSGRGRHLWFKHPGGDFWIPNRGKITLPIPEWYQDVCYVNEKRRRLELDNLQIRGDGGYVVAAPSLHASGRSYRWSEERNPKCLADAAEIPPALLALLVRSVQVAPEGEAPEGDWPELERRIYRAQRYLESVPGAVSGQGGHDATFGMACDLVRGFVLPLDVSYQMMCDYNSKCVPPWDMEDIARKVEQAAYSSFRPYGYKFKDDAARELLAEARRAKEEEDIMSAQLAEEAANLAAEVLEEETGGPNPPGPPTPRGPGGGHGDEGPRGFHHTFITGSEAEIAEVYRAQLEEGGRILTYSESFFWLYDPNKGVWVKQDEKIMEADIARYDQCPVGEKLLRVSASMCSGVMRILTNSYGSANHRGETRRRIYRFNSDVRGIAFRNGFLSIRVAKNMSDLSIELVPHSPSNLARFYIDIDWKDEAYPSPMFDRFVENLFFDVTDPEEKKARMNLIQEFVGVALGGVATALQTYLILLGGGSNGKSELLKLIKQLFDQDHISFVPPDQFDKNFQLRPLVGSFLNIVDDMPATALSSSASSKLRSIVAGHNVHLDVKNREPTTFEPIAAHLYAANEMFAFPENTEGSWRRVLVLPMTANFQNHPERAIPRASEQIIENELPQVVQWAIRGLIRLVREQSCKFSSPSGSSAAKSVWKEESDVMYRFLVNIDKETRESLNSTKGVLSTKLLQIYSDWIRSESPQAFHSLEMTSTAFGRKIKSSGLVEWKKTNLGIVYFAAQKLVDLWQECADFLEKETRAYQEAASKPRVLHLVRTAPPKDAMP